MVLNGSSSKTITRSKPTIFVGSSSERLPVVRSLCAALRKDAHVLRWDDNVFVPGRYTLEDLEAAMKRSDFAVFVFAGEDIVKWRKRVSPAPRDNVVLEIGMAIGILGRRRLSLLYSRKDRAKIPSDLQGFNYVPFDDLCPRRTAIAQARLILGQQLIAEGLRELPTDSDQIITQVQRSAFSTAFAEKCIGRFDTFAGDLSWLQKDLGAFRALADRGVRLRFLTDNPNATVIRKAKAVGMEFRRYATGTEAQVKASISDGNNELSARALVVQKVVLPPQAESTRKPYDYRMKVYRAPKEYPVIRALENYFETLFTAGQAL